MPLAHGSAAVLAPPPLLLALVAAAVLAAATWAGGRAGLHAGVLLATGLVVLRPPHLSARVTRPTAAARPTRPQR